MSSFLPTAILCYLYVVLGQQTAMKWYVNGCRTLDDLRAGKGGVNLTEGQKIGLEFYEGIFVFLHLWIPLLDRKCQTSTHVCLAKKQRRFLSWLNQSVCRMSIPSDLCFNRFLQRFVLIRNCLWILWGVIDGTVPYFLDVRTSDRLYSGKSDCGDIDILITRCPDDGHTHEGNLSLGAFCSFLISF